VVKPEDLTNEQLLYHAVMYLIQTDKQEAAKLLVECELEQWKYSDDDPVLFVTLSASSAVQTMIASNPDTIHHEETPLVAEWDQHLNLRRNEISDAFSAILRNKEPYLQVLRMFS